MVSALLHSEHIDAIAAALAKAQGGMENAAKDRTNPAFRSQYATLAAVRDATTGPLSANGIACVQAPAIDSDCVSVETRLIHSSGQWIACVVSAVPVDHKPQSIGSAITYLRRYGLMAMTGVAPEDDDGNASSVRPAPAAPAAPEKPAPNALQAAMLAAKARGWTPEQLVSALHGRNSRDVPGSEWPGLLDTFAGAPPAGGA